MATAPAPYRSLQRRLILRDSLVFVVLTLIVAALFAVTLFLFKSFTTHREDLAKRWYLRGQQDLAAHQPAQAINSLRNALGFDPDNRDYEAALADALDQAGELDQSFAYFSGLLEAQPGSGPLNLQLARVSLKKGAIADALHYYRASIYGNWENDALKNRRATRLELIQSMLDYGEHDAARTELLLASEDADEDDPATLSHLVSLMSQAREYALALPLYNKALAAQPKDAALLEGAGNAAFSVGRYTSAQKYLQQAASLHNDELASGPRTELDLSEKITNLFPGPGLSASERFERIQRAANVVPSLLTTCREQIASRGGDTTSIDDLEHSWDDEKKKPTATPRRAPDAQSEELQLIYRISNQTAQACPATTGDALLLQMIAKSPEAVLQ